MLSKITAVLITVSLTIGGIQDMAWSYILTNQLPWVYTTDSRAHNNMQIAWNYFRSQGYTEEAVAGILGNMTYEGVCNPGQYELNQSMTDPNTGRGLIGWTGVISGMAKIEYWAVYDYGGVNWYDGDYQLRVIHENHNGQQFFPNTQAGYIYSWEAYQQIGDIGQATRAYFWEAERGTVSTIPDRIDMANFWYNEFHGSGPVPGTGLPLWMMGRENIRRNILHA